MHAASRVPSCIDQFVQFPAYFFVRVWALGLGLFLAAAVPLLSPFGSLTYPAVPTALFDFTEIEAVSFIENGFNAAIPEHTQPVSNGEQAAPLFGMDTVPLFGGNLFEKWSRAQAEITRELEALNRCRASDTCTADAQRLIDFSAEGAARNGRARVGLINRAVDLAIVPASDETQWGVPDHWSAPFETIRSGRGDCEDYAIIKYAALLEAGIPSDDVKIVILKNAFPNEDHAVLAARVDGEWLILDNRTLTLVRDMDLTRATPEFVLDREGVRRFVSGSRSHRAAS
jgi:predicted transglutaminase-like cysteine proteinase